MNGIFEVYTAFTSALELSGFTFKAGLTELQGEAGCWLCLHLSCLNEEIKERVSVFRKE